MKPTALITGSTRGIGLATAAEFLQRGFRVAIFCRHESHVRQAHKLLAKAADTVDILGLIGDVRTPADVKRIISQSFRFFGRIDVLVNNAGIAAFKDIEKTADSLWDAIIDTNLKGCFLFSREVLPFMKKQGHGIIINVSSILGIAAEAGFSAYCASKFGIIGLTQALADETAAAGIRVYTVLPWAVKTKLNRNLKLHMKDSDLLLPEDVARKIVQLARGKQKSGAALKIYP